MNGRSGKSNDAGKSKLTRTMQRDFGRTKIKVGEMGLLTRINGGQQ